MENDLTRGLVNVLALDMGEKWIGTAVYLCSRLPQGDSLSENGANDVPPQNDIPPHIGNDNDHGRDDGRDNVSNQDHENEDENNDVVGSYMGNDMGNDGIGSHDVPMHVTKHGGVILPLKPLQRKNESLCLGALRRLCERYAVEKIIVGLPKAHGDAWRHKNDGSLDAHMAWGFGDLSWDHENSLVSSSYSHSHSQPQPQPQPQFQSQSQSQIQGVSTRHGAPQRSKRRLPGMRSKVKAYVKRLKHHFGHLQIGMVDEAYTTWTVQERFPGIGKHARAEGIDSLSAVCIVQAYLHESTG